MEDLSKITNLELIQYKFANPNALDDKAAIFEELCYENDEKFIEDLVLFAKSNPGSALKLFEQYAYAQGSDCYEVNAEGTDVDIGDIGGADEDDDFSEITDSLKKLALALELDEPTFTVEGEDLEDFLADRDDDDEDSEDDDD